MLMSGIEETEHKEVWMISKTARNALRAVLSVAEREASGPVSAKALARELDLPHNYLSKTLYRLVQHGILAATRGRGGGYVLAAPATALTLGRIVEAIDPDGPERRCLLGRPQCSEINPCAMHGRWCEVREAIDRFFAETTVGDLLAPAAPMVRGRSPLPAAKEPNAMSDTSSPSSQPPPAEPDAPVPLMQRLYDSPFLLLAACIVVMFVFFTAWGMLEIMSLEPAPLP
ncbi:MAG: Rrf2 family transcriptional regulator [Gemmatimonadetes bacterium]|nr:Rrf2 family transcriptional regulator [Gemmatimonadota bacterium]MYJ67512.1 Rrf2 family transcriptional regulator [Gemmatimonadota bacterium]